MITFIGEQDRLPMAKFRVQTRNNPLKNQLSILIWILSSSFLLLAGCTGVEKESQSSTRKIPVIFDTDANNELDDQHALAYLLLNGETFEVRGITVNATYNGGQIDEHYKEAERILELCQLSNKIPLIKGANEGFEEIKNNIEDPGFDGHKAVDFIIDQASRERITLIAVGKLTNVALALMKEPSISPNLRVVWLGSNYPKPGEYNQDNDTSSMNYVLQTDVLFEMVTVRYGEPSGTDAIRITQAQIDSIMPGKGPQLSNPVTGRHGGRFYNFGDYSVSLFKYIDYYGDPPSRALFDLAAVAIIKNPEWAEASPIPSPILKNNTWVEQPDNPRKIIVWENFDKERIIADLIFTLEDFVPVTPD